MIIAFIIGILILLYLLGWVVEFQARSQEEWKQRRQEAWAFAKSLLLFCVFPIFLFVGVMLYGATINWLLGN